MLLSEINKCEPLEMWLELPIAGTQQRLSYTKIEPRSQGGTGILKGHISSEMAGKGVPEVTI